jgi:hypothetical protein
MTYDDLSPRDQAFINELGGDNKTVVSAQMVSALNGNGNAAIYLSQLLWWGKRKADEDGWFFRTRDQMQERCGLGKQAQRTAEKTLKTLGLIETDKRGMPAKKHYRIQYKELISLFNGDESDPALTRKDKSQGVGGATSSGGYVPEQDAGGTCQNPIESNTENNTESGTAPAHEDPVDCLEAMWAVRPTAYQKDRIRQVVDDVAAWEDVLDELKMQNKDSKKAIGWAVENYQDRPTGDGAPASKYYPSDDPDL